MSNENDMVGLSLSFPTRNVFETLNRLAQRELICRASLNTLKNKAGHCPETVKKSLAQLEQLGLIRVVQDVGKSNLYIVYRVFTNDQ